MTDNRIHRHQRLRRLLLSCLIVTVLALPGPARADAATDMFGFMFRMMLTMMNVMASAANTSSGGWGDTGYPFGTGATAWPLMSSMYGLGGGPGSGVGMSPMNPSWTGMQFPGGYPGMMNYPLTGMPYGNPYRRNGWFNRRGLPYPAGALLLDGTWYGTTGETLHIRGQHFSLRNGLIVLNGIIKLQNNLLTLYTPQTNSVQVYTFARNLTELILRDRQGKILTFRMSPGRFR